MQIPFLHYSSLLHSSFFSLLIAAPLVQAAANDQLSIDDRRSPIEEVIITSHPLYEGGSAQSLSVLGGEELEENLQSSLGETVAHLPGISSASFGPAVGRPVIHGLGGTRVKTTQDRIDSLDVSVASSDHAVSIEPFIANQINILKGASTLLYGSGAIGGVVDVETGRIAKTLPEKKIQGRAEVRFTDNSDSRSGALRLDGAVDKLAWHLDAFSKKADDYDIPSLLNLGNNPKNRSEVLAGSRAKGSGGAVGLSYIGKRGFIGISLNNIDAEYGLISAQQEPPGLIDMQQTRVDFDAHLDAPFDGFLELNLRVGINDYQHQEIEGSGEVGSLFENDAWEGRLELVHFPVWQFEGQVGLQISARDFSAIGEEAFVPPVNSTTYGLFWVAERAFSNFDLELGARVEEVQHEPSPSELNKLSFNTSSASLGVVVPLNSAFTVSALLDYSSRAPSIEELFSNGPHLATQSFEVGKLDLKKEDAIAATLTFDYQSTWFDIKTSIYQMSFDDFIYQQNTAEIEDGLPVFLYQQDDARFTGLDLLATIPLGELAAGDTQLELLFDVVNAHLTSASRQDLPRIPAKRFGANLVWDNETWKLSLKYLKVAEQNNVADFELPSEDYDDISILISRQIQVAGNDFKISLHGRNLSNDIQRNHASFIKDFAPAPGRRVELGLRYQF